MKRKMATAILCTVLMAQSTGALAETRANPTAMIGSDTFNQMMDSLLVDIAIIDGAGIESYSGLGSSSGERQLTGTPSATEPPCSGPTTGPGGENAGCQEIAPMSRPLGSTACAAGNSEAPGNAEGLAICRDGLVIVTDNVSFGQYGDSPAECAAYATFSAAGTDNAGASPVFLDHGVGNMRKSGTLPGSGYVIGAGMAAGTEWRDVVRLIYTGCDQDDGTCMTSNGAGTVAGAPSRVRTERCNSAVRNELLSSWSNIFAGDDCDATAGDNCSADGTADGNVDSGLKHAFRRDDSSGTTGVFLELLGVRGNLTGRSKVPATLSEAGATTGCTPGAAPGARILITPIPQHHAFCDGGDLENWFPDCQNGVVTAIGGDPIRKDCGLGDDLCAPDGKAGVVQAIRSTRGETPYPTHQCTRGLFGKQNYLASAYPVCPDGTVPSAGQCRFPYWRNPTNSADINYNCANPSNSRPSTVPLSTDGRAYNHAMRSVAGAVSMPNPGNLPEVANWRFNMVNMVTSGIQNIQGKVYAASEYVCTEADATRNIGCLVGQTTCSVGFAGREAAYTTANDAHLLNEPAQLQDSGPTDALISGFVYPFARELFMNAIGGFENISADCAARGDDPVYCAEQLEIANEFFETGTAGNVIAGLCEESGFIPLTAATCVGAIGTAGCGAPVTQALSACTPM